MRQPASTFLHPVLGQPCIVKPGHEGSDRLRDLRRRVEKPCEVPDLPSPRTSGSFYGRSLSSSPFDPKPGRSCDRVEYSPRKRRRTNVDRNPQIFQHPSEISPVDCWVQSAHWPAEYFEPPTTMPSPSKKRSSSSVRDGSSRGDANSERYKSTLYLNQLEAAGIYLTDARVGVTDDCKKLCQTLLKTAQDVPSKSAFDEKVFQSTSEIVQRRSEAWIVHHLTPLVVPSAEALFLGQTIDADYFSSSINERWTKIKPLVWPIPQPDYSVGFRPGAFTVEQRSKLEPYVKDPRDLSILAPTVEMYFPFLTCEVKRGGESLNVADKQNANSASVAVRALVELYRASSREAELHRKILAFSVSHDSNSARLYGHYALTDTDKLTFYRHLIEEFYFSSQRWTAYQFVRNVYEHFVPDHLASIRAAIDRLPIPISQVPSANSFGVESVDASQQTEGSPRSLMVDEETGEPADSEGRKRIRSPRNNLIQRVRSHEG